MGALSLSRRARLWLVWLLVVFGALNVFGPPIDATRRADDPPSIGWKALQRASDRFRKGDEARCATTATSNAISLMRKLDLRPPLYRGFRPARRQNRPRKARPTRYGSWRRSARFAPWRDFAVEYPPGMMAAALLPSLMTGDEDAIFPPVRAGNGGRADARRLACGADGRSPLAGRGRRRARPRDAGSPLALGVIAVRRYDPTVALAIAARDLGAGVAPARHERRGVWSRGRAQRASRSCSRRFS